MVDHATGRLVWAGEGRNSETLGRFFDELGAARAARLTHVSCDGAAWISGGPTRTASTICLDPFHVVAWALKALDKVRVRTMTRRDPRSARDVGDAQNPADLTGEQRTSLAAIADTNAALYRSYLLKEQLREVFRAKGNRPAVTGRVAVVGVRASPSS